MSEALITKRALAASLKHLMETRPLARVTVRDLVDDCGVNRQTFYYHFKDKFELVNWIYRSEAMESIHGLDDYSHWNAGISRVFAYLYDNKSFYVNALNDPGPNSFDGYLFDATHDLILGVVDEVAADLQVAREDRAFVADFYSFAFVGLAVRWIKTGMEEGPQSITERIGEVVEGSMRRALEKLAGPPGPLLAKPTAPVHRTPG